jgi:hypothetical protein
MVGLVTVENAAHTEGGSRRVVRPVVGSVGLPFQWLGFLDPEPVALSSRRRLELDGARAARDEELRAPPCYFMAKTVNGLMITPCRVKYENWLPIYSVLALPAKGSVRLLCCDVIMCAFS